MNKKKQTLKENFIEAFKKYKNHDFKNAEQSCYKILSIDPNHFDSISLLATISFSKKDFNKAKELMLQAIEIKPNDLSALNNLGTTYRELREAKEAINVYKKVLEINVLTRLWQLSSIQRLTLSPIDKTKSIVVVGLSINS